VGSYVRRKTFPGKVRGTADPLGFAPPDFLWNLVALTDFMRLSLRERRTRNLVQCSVAGNPGRDDKGEGDLLLNVVFNRERLGPSTTLYETVALSFVIPSEAEGSAVPLTGEEIFHFSDIPR
jgi:hypothetical protein